MSRDIKHLGETNSALLFQINANVYTKAEIFETDINTVYLELYPIAGATSGTSGIQLNAIGEICGVYWWNSPFIDPSRDIDIYVIFQRQDAGADTIDITKTLTGSIADGGADTVSQWATVADTLDACAANRYISQKFTLTAANNFNNYRYFFDIVMNEAAKDIIVQNIVLVYYVKRTI